MGNARSNILILNGRQGTVNSDVKSDFCVCSTIGRIIQWTIEGSNLALKRWLFWEQNLAVCCCSTIKSFFLKSFIFCVCSTVGRIIHSDVPMCGIQFLRCKSCFNRPCAPWNGCLSSNFIWAWYLSSYGVWKNLKIYQFSVCAFVCSYFLSSFLQSLGLRYKWDFGKKYLFSENFVVKLCPAKIAARGFWIKCCFYICCFYFLWFWFALTFYDYGNFI